MLNLRALALLLPALAACAALGQEPLPTVVPLQFSAGTINCSNPPESRRFGSEVWWCVSAGGGLGVGRNTFVTAGLSYSTRHLSEFPVRASYVSAASNVILQTGLRYRIPLTTMLSLTVGAGISWYVYFGGIRNDRDDEFISYFPFFLSPGAEFGPADEHWRVFLESAFEREIFHRQNERFSALTGSVGIRWYIGNHTSGREEAGQ